MKNFAARSAEQGFNTVVFGAAAIFFAWFTLSFLLAIPVIPSPFSVAARLRDIFFSGILPHAAASFFRIAAGVAAAVAIGFPLGLWMGRSDAANRRLSPSVYILYPIPKIALLPILMLLLGVGESSKIALIFLIVVFQVVVSIRDAVSAIDEETFYPLRALSASNFDIFREVLFPALLPTLITALRVAMATAVSVLFFAETYGTQSGMGWFITDAWLRVNYLDMYAGLVVLSAMGVAIFGALDMWERHINRWQRD